jgi:hypothetical protein
MSWPGWDKYVPNGLISDTGRVSRQTATAAKGSKGSAYADTLGFQCRALGLPEPASEFYFAKPRMWRFDFCWVDRKLALEVQGGLFKPDGGGRHNRGAALLREYDKLNAAAALGYRVTFTTPKALTSGETMTWLEPMLR